MTAAVLCAAANAIAIDAWTSTSDRLHAASPVVTAYTTVVVLIGVATLVSTQRGARALVSGRR